MTYRTAIVLCVVLIAAMFIIPAMVKPLIYHYADQRVAIPSCVRMLFGFTTFWLAFRFLLIPPIIAGLFLTAALTNKTRAGAS